ncbi:MAG TPA: hypothetical protein VNO79_15230 [Actinomycetota bacterium]|nr:hypothetical protein [Actinomycetota bacterium]
MRVGGWLPLAGLGIIWAAFLLPRRRTASPEASVEEFERRMRLLAQADRPAGRWIVAPAKGARFLGPRERARARARARRRRVLAFLLEAVGLTFLIGLAPPLRPVWYATGVLAGALALYVWLLLWLKGREPGPRLVASAPPGRATGTFARAQRYVAEGVSRIPRPAWGGLGEVGDDDLVHVVVRRASAGG